MDRILQYLENDGSTGTKGLIQRVSDTEDRHDELEDNLNRLEAQIRIDKELDARDKKWYATIFGAIGASIMLAGKFILGIIFK